MCCRCVICPVSGLETCRYSSAGDLSPYATDVALAEMHHPAWTVSDCVRLTVDFVADPANVRAVRKLIAAAARIEGATDFETLAIEVAVGEVLVRGRLLARDRIGAVSLSTELSHSRCVVSISEPNTPQHAGTPGNDQADERLRWGLHIIAQLMDEVEIRPSPGKGQTSILRLVKQLGKDRTPPS